MARGGTGVAGHIFKRPKPDPSWPTYRAVAGRYSRSFQARSAAHAARQLIRSIDKRGAALDGEEIAVVTPKGDVVRFEAAD
jgi:hypothetical protein